MEKLAKWIGVTVTSIFAAFVLVIVRSLFGALAGWIVGLIFGDTILAIFQQLGIVGMHMWQLGTFLGFVGGFLSTSVFTKKTD